VTQLLLGLLRFLTADLHFGQLNRGTVALTDGDRPVYVTG
jgi:hypothetical protein